MIQKLLPPIASLVARTLRIKWEGASIAPRAVIVFWHGAMFAGWWSVRNRIPVALVSASKDGAILSAVLQHWGYQLVRGSSGKKGMEALQEAIGICENGVADALVLTPDGPRGPAMQFKRGAFIAANALHVPLYFLDVRFSRAVTLRKSWDHFKVPLPFTRVTITVREIPMKNWPTENKELQNAWLTAASPEYRVEDIA